MVLEVCEEGDHASIARRGGACVLCSGFAFRHAFFNPDVKIDKSMRKSGSPPSAEKGEAWRSHKDGLANAADVVKRR